MPCEYGAHVTSTVEPHDVLVVHEGGGGGGGGGGAGGDGASMHAPE
jgi:hypothetical protein